MVIVYSVVQIGWDSVGACWQARIGLSCSGPPVVQFQCMSNYLLPSVVWILIGVYGDDNSRSEATEDKKPVAKKQKKKKN